jgi:hypothetical protein
MRTRTGLNAKFQLHKYYEVKSEVDDVWYIMKILSAEKFVKGVRVYNLNDTKEPFYSVFDTVNIVDEWYYTGPYTFEKIQDKYPEYFI